MSEVLVQQKQTLRIVVASPNDVQPERNLLPALIEELNRGIAAALGFHLDLSRWETDAFPGFHPEGPQGLIDSVLQIENCDLLLGIFWQRFGTPVKDAASGTEHEFRLAYEAWKARQAPQVMIYFNEKPPNPKSKVELDQLGRVLEFKESFPKEGLWWSYKGKTEFVKLVRNHLTQFLRRAKVQPATESVGGSSGFLREYRKRLSSLYSRWDLAPVGVAQSGGGRPAN